MRPNLKNLLEVMTKFDENVFLNYDQAKKIISDFFDNTLLG